MVITVQQKMNPKNAKKKNIYITMIHRDLLRMSRLKRASSPAIIMIQLIRTEHILAIIIIYLEAEPKKDLPHNSGARLSIGAYNFGCPDNGPVTTCPGLL